MFAIRTALQVMTILATMGNQKSIGDYINLQRKSPIWHPVFGIHVPRLANFPCKKYYFSDFVTHSYGGSWDSSCEKSRVPVHNQ